MEPEGVCGELMARVQGDASCDNEQALRLAQESGVGGRGATTASMKTDEDSPV